MTKKVKTIRLDADVLDRITQQAGKSMRSASKQIEFYILKGLKADELEK